MHLPVGELDASLLWHANGDDEWSMQKLWNWKIRRE